MRAQDVELGHLAMPEGANAGSLPGVVLVHDVWGLGDHARDMTRRLAAEGFAVLGVDLYRRLDEVQIADPGAWMRGLSDPEVLEDIGAAAAFLAQEPAVAGRKVGVTGFCMGGMYTLLAACGTSGLSAAAPFYGMLSYEHGLMQDPAGSGPDSARKPRQPLDALPDLACPLLAFFGEEDPYVPLKDVEDLQSRLAGSTHEVEVVVYPGAGHAFMNDTRPDAYRKEAARDAWSRLVAFLQRSL